MSISIVKIILLIVLINYNLFSEIPYKCILIDLQNPFIPNMAFLDQYPPLGFGIGENYMSIHYNFGGEYPSTVHLYSKNYKEVTFQSLMRSIPDSVKNKKLSDKNDTAVVLVSWMVKEGYEYFMIKEDKNYLVKSNFILNDNSLQSDSSFVEQFQKKNILLKLDIKKTQYDNNCFNLLPLNLFFPKKLLGLSIYMVWTDFKNNFCELQYHDILKSNDFIGIQVFEGNRSEQELDSINNGIFEFYMRDSVATIKKGNHTHICSWFIDKEKKENHNFQFYQYYNGYTYLVKYGRTNCMVIPKESTFIDSLFVVVNNIIDNK